MSEFALTVFREGDGQDTLVVLPNRNVSAGDLARALSLPPKTLRISVATGLDPLTPNTNQSVLRLEQELARQKLRRITLLGFGAGALLAQAYIIAKPKLVRRAVFVNPISRREPRSGEKLWNVLDRLFPAGLPLRPLKDDLRSALHRVRCPVLILTTPEAVPFVREEAAFISRAVPNAWKRELTLPQESGKLIATEEMSEAIAEFLEVPTKRPWKNLGATQQTAEIVNQ